MAELKPYAKGLLREAGTALPKREVNSSNDLISSLLRFSQKLLAWIQGQVKIPLTQVILALLLDIKTHI